MSVQLGDSRPRSSGRMVGLGALGLAAAIAAIWWMRGAEPTSAPLPAPSASQASAVQAVPDLLAAAEAPAEPPAPPLEPREGEMLASELMVQYRATRGSVDARFKGQRLKILGRIARLEEAESGLIMVSMEADQDLSMLRAVMANDAAAKQELLMEGRALVLDCQHQGMVMGEPILNDCRVTRQ